MSKNISPPHSLTIQISKALSLDAMKSL
jgi:hypothetical protein